MARQRITREQRESKRALEREQVERSVQALLTSEGWQRWAETRRAFRAYSFGNQLLIAMQAPNATAVAGYRAWQGLGRQVRRGEHGIRIMAPMIVGGDKDERRELRKRGPVVQVTSGDKMPDDHARVLFHMVSVFDVAQTEGGPLPEPPRPEPITGESCAALLPMLEAFAQSRGVTVRTGATKGQGHYDHGRHEIVLSDELTSANQRCHVLVHELAHCIALPNYTDYGRETTEVLAETAATITCSSLGLDTSGESIPYIASWAESGDLAAIRRYAETVDRIASELEQACEKFIDER